MMMLTYIYVVETLVTVRNSDDVLGVKMMVLTYIYVVETLINVRNSDNVTYSHLVDHTR